MVLRHGRGRFSLELLLIRHGLPVHVAHDDGRAADPPLSAEGRAQAERLAQWLREERIDRVISSPLLRAQETAEPLARSKGLEIEHEPGVVEMDYGRSEYIPLEQLKEQDYERWREAVQGGIHAGIDMQAFRRKVCDAIARIVDDSPRQRVAITCHGGVVNAWAGEILGIERPFFFEPVYTSVSRFLVSSAGTRSVVSLNEAAHLHPSVAAATRG